MIRMWLPIFAVGYILFAAGSALAAEIKVLHATALKPPLDVLFTAFSNNFAFRNCR